VTIPVQIHKRKAVFLIPPLEFHVCTFQVIEPSSAGPDKGKNTSAAGLAKW
jgi:hypothetical protein